MASKIDVDNMVSEKQSRFNGQLGVEKAITIDQLLKPNEDTNLVLIQGAGGVGKSYMMETAALHWAQGKIWKDVSFLFLFQFLIRLIEGGGVLIRSITVYSLK